MGNIPLAGCSFHFLGPLWDSATQWSGETVSVLRSTLPQWKPRWKWASFIIICSHLEAAHQLSILWNLVGILWDGRSGGWETDPMGRGVSGRVAKEETRGIPLQPTHFASPVSSVLFRMQDPIVYQQDANSGSFCKWHSAFLFAMTPFLSGIWFIKPSLFPQLFISPVEKSDVDFVCNFLVIKEVEVFCILLNLIGGEVPFNNIMTYNAKYLCWCWPPEFQRQRQELLCSLMTHLFSPDFMWGTVLGAAETAKVDGTWILLRRIQMPWVGWARAHRSIRWACTRCIGEMQKNSYGSSEAREIVSSF